MRKYQDDDVTTQLRQPAASYSVMPRYRLEVIAGPDRGGAFVLDPEMAAARVLVGTSPACALRLTDPHVSRRHAAIDAHREALRLTDLDSTNGTYVNGLRVGAAYLVGGETLRIGDTSLLLSVLDPAAHVPVSTATSFGKLVGSSVEMRRLYPLFERLAASDVPVVIEGETGTGKEALAESIHEASARAGGPFMVFDCASVPPNLVESELFGHERGAFVGAVSARPGVFEQAHGGTLLIDEIGDFDLALQPKLLRAIQRSEVRRIGGDRWLRVDVRVLAATRRDLDREVQAGRFRDDLFYRLAVTRVELPPLRDRRGDVAVLAHHAWRELGGVGELPFELLLRCEAYSWPGNVRELCNEIARRIALGDLASGTDPGLAARESAPPAPPAASTQGTGDFMQQILELDLPLLRARQRVVDQFQRLYVERVVAKHGGNVVHAAAASGIAHRYFQILRARQAKR